MSNTKDFIAIRDRIGQLLSGNKSKTALDAAKDLYKAQPGPESEALLLDAYTSRINALTGQNLAVEAKALADIVRQRFPASRQRLDALQAAVVESGHDITGLLAPLAQPDLSPEPRAAIFDVLKRRVTDLAAVAACSALPLDHPVRTGAAAVDRAFVAVTSGPVTDEQIALAEISHRSPFAPWKMLIRAIACFYRGQDESCAASLAAIDAESAAARLVPALRFLLSGEPVPQGSAVGFMPTPAPQLTAAEATLVQSTRTDTRCLAESLAKADRSFAHAGNPAVVLRDARAALDECRRSAPDLVDALRDMLFIKCEMAGIELDRVVSTLGGTRSPSAVFYRNLACGMEHTGDPEDKLLACQRWDMFRKQALREGWFAERSVAEAALYLHMAATLQEIPEDLLRHMTAAGRQHGEDTWYLSSEQLFTRACMIDPHTEAFRRWLAWAVGHKASAAEALARTWSKALPADVEPTLFLMEAAEKRNSWPTALTLLDRAEQQDGVNPRIRTARLRLLVNSVLRHLQQKKAHLATAKLEELSALPQALQEERPALLTALRVLALQMSGDHAAEVAARNELQTLLGDWVAASLMLFCMASLAKCTQFVDLVRVKDLSPTELADIPLALARVIVVTRSFDLHQSVFPVEYCQNLAKKLQKASDDLTVPQLHALGEFGIGAKDLPLAWAASTAGLGRGGTTEGYFMLLRARALPPRVMEDERLEVLAAAAAELGRLHGDRAVVERAVELARNPFGGDPVTLSAPQAREVIQRELAKPKFPVRYGMSPDYSDMLDTPDWDEEFPQDPDCQCPECRRKRGEDDENDDGFPGFGSDAPPLTETEMRKSFFEGAPDDVPLETLELMFEAAKQAFQRGQNPLEILKDIIGSSPKTGRGREKKGKRK